jgi:hypothetical protein
MSSMQPDMGRMQCFVASLLARHGALAEPIDPEGLDVLAPPPVQQILQVSELSRLGFGATLPDGAERVGIENDWLERCGRLIGERGRYARLVRPAEAPAPSDAQRALEQALAVDNASIRLADVSPGWTRYAVLDFRYSAVSDEKRDGILRLGVNLATGALADTMAARLTAEHLADTADAASPAEAELPADWEPYRLLELVERALYRRLEAALAPFVTGLRRRLGRDQERLYSYHADLHREAMRRGVLLAEGNPARQREERRLEAIEREYGAKLHDLARQYAMRVSVTWVQTLEIVTQVQRFAVRIRRRKAERVIHLDWNPFVRRLESPPCEFSYGPDRPRLVCDDALHLVTPDGMAACAGCGRVFCHACHRERCPKCQHSVVARPMAASGAA